MQTWANNAQIPLAEFVGGGAGGVGHSASIAWGNVTVTHPYHATWLSWWNGITLQNTLGWAQKLFGGAPGPGGTAPYLNRIIPLQHPFFPTYYCNGLGGGDPICWQYKATGISQPWGGGNLGVAPYSAYDRIRISLSFAPPAFWVATDAQLVAAYPLGGVINSTGAAQLSSNVIQNVSGAFCVGMSISDSVGGTVIPGNTTIIGVGPTPGVPANGRNNLILSNQCLSTNVNFAFTASGNFAQEQWRFCTWNEEPKVEFAQRDGSAFTYTELGYTNGPSINTAVFTGFVAVPKATKTVTCEWRFVPINYVRNSKNLPSNLDAAHGKVNNTDFPTPKGTFKAGTALLKNYHITDEVSPIPLPNIVNGQPQALQKVSLTFEVFDTTTLKNPGIMNPIQGYNCGWYPVDGNWYAIGATPVNAGFTTPQPPFSYYEFQSIFQCAQ
jgi:hypothetical protein